MPKRRRKSNPNGIITVLVLVLGAALLIIAGNLLRGTPPRRVVPAAGVERPGPNGAGRGPEILDEEKRELERILRRETPG